MTMRVAAVLLGAILVCSCTENTVAGTTPQPRLSATVSPNPLAAPAGPGDMLWDVQFRASGSGTILIERGEARLFDAAGLRVGETIEFWSRSAGCNSCSTDFTMAQGSSAQFSRKHIRYVGGGAPVRFVYTISYSDDLGPGSATVQVPVR